MQARTTISSHNTIVVYKFGNQSENDYAVIFYARFSLFYRVLLKQGILVRHSHRHAPRSLLPEFQAATSDDHRQKGAQTWLRRGDDIFMCRVRKSIFQKHPVKYVFRNYTLFIMICNKLKAIDNDQIDGVQVFNEIVFSFKCVCFVLLFSTEALYANLAILYTLYMQYRTKQQVVKHGYCIAD